MAILFLCAVLVNRADSGHSQRFTPASAMRTKRTLTTPPRRLKLAAMTELSLGQVWVCNADGAVPPLMCIVGKLDQFTEQSDSPRVVSLLVTPHPEAKKAGWPTVAHMPVFEDAFFRSELQLVKDGVVLGHDFDDGYARWLAAFQEGNAGAFSLSVSEAYSGAVSVRDTR